MTPERSEAIRTVEEIVRWQITGHPEHAPVAERIVDTLLALPDPVRDCAREVVKEINPDWFPAVGRLRSVLDGGTVPPADPDLETPDLERNEALVRLSMREAECEWLRTVEVAAIEVVDAFFKTGDMSNARMGRLRNALKGGKDAST